MSSCPAPHDWRVASPDARNVILVSLDARGRLTHRALRDGRPLLAPSALALDLRPGGLLSDHLRVLEEKTATHDETFPIIGGKASHGRDHHHALSLVLEEHVAPHRRVHIEWRAYDDGLAFRYFIPAQPALPAGSRLIAELTEFRFPADTDCWATSYPHFASSFESEFVPTRLSALRVGQIVGLPLTLRTTEGEFAALTEAALTTGAGLYLESAANGSPALRSRLSQPADGTYGACELDGDFRTSWRVLQVAPTAARLVESTLLLALNPPPAFDTSWIKPGRVTWDWWSGWTDVPGDWSRRMTDEHMKTFIDSAAALGNEYMLIDGGWHGQATPPTSDIFHSLPTLDIPGLVRYAHARNVRVLLWLDSKDLPGRADQAFALYRSWGVDGVKIDFFDRDDQDCVRFVVSLLETAARHRLLVDLHGIYKPTGLERTWPHLLASEGVLGAEYNKWSRRVTPTHNVTLPFTRMLAGPMDYTPGAFDNVAPEAFVPRDMFPMVMGTRAHHLAMYVVYQCGLQMVSEHPTRLHGQPGEAFLRHVPAAWDETRGLDGAIAEYVVIARRRGPEWFLGAMCAAAARELVVPLTFLNAGDFTAELYADAPDSGENPKNLAVSTLAVTRDTILPLRLGSNGGCAIRFRPAF